jgi:hypothetical protein
LQKCSASVCVSRAAAETQGALGQHPEPGGHPPGYLQDAMRALDRITAGTNPTLEMRPAAGSKNQEREVA